jgi:hypothetical protein
MGERDGAGPSTAAAALMTNETRTAVSVLDEILCTALAVGLVLVALLPAARGASAIGWLPMWLVGMPAVAWWALHGFAIPRRAAVVEASVPVRAMRRIAPQARRTARPTRTSAVRRAA